jgi:hypothetical protein
MPRNLLTARLTPVTACLAGAYLVCSTALTGCERAADKTGRSAAERNKPLIVMIGPPENHAQWPGIRGGAERYLKAVPGVRAAFLVPTDESPASLRAVADQACGMKPRTVCLYVEYGEPAGPIVDQITGCGAFVVTIGQRLEGAGVSAHVGVDLVGGAGLLAENLERVAPGRKSYLLIHESGSTPLATSLYQRFRQAAERQYDLHLLEERNAAEQDLSYRDLLMAAADHYRNVGMIVTLDPRVWLSDDEALKQDLLELSRKRDSYGLGFATLSAAPRLWAWLGPADEPGEVAALALVGPLDGELGYAAMQLAGQLALASEVSSTSRLIRCELVTPENLGDFAGRYSQAANGLDVSALLPAPESAAGASTVGD